MTILESPFSVENFCFFSAKRLKKKLGYFLHCLSLLIIYLFLFPAKRGRRPSPSSNGGPKARSCDRVTRLGIRTTKVKKKFWRPRLDDDPIKSDTFFYALKYAVKWPNFFFNLFALKSDPIFFFNLFALKSDPIFFSIFLH